MAAPPFLVYLIRHAHAGERGMGRRDLYRPLSETGRQQAEAISADLIDLDVSACHSSPAVRCTQTLEPLAAALSLEVESQPDLWEDARIDDALALLESLAKTGIAAGQRGVAACSHGNIIPGVLESMGQSGVPITGRGCEKGSVWVLEYAAGRWIGARRRG